MQQTINFLKIIDKPLKTIKRRTMSDQKEERGQSPGIISAIDRRKIKLENFQYAKGMQFAEEKLELFPAWLRNRDDFILSRYNDYEKKLLTLPKICQKKPEDRSSDQLYFLSMYVTQNQMFKGLSSVVSQLILKEMGVRYYKKGQIIHDQQNDCEFLAIIFLGQVQYKVEGGRQIRKGKNEVIMNKCFYNREFPTVTAKQQSILFTVNNNVYNKLQQTLKGQIEDKYKDDMQELTKSDLFTQLHIKDKKCKQMLGDFQIEFYFKGQTVCECGDNPEKFYILLVGSLLRQNHIYIREHNKWPLPHGRWQIRAVYNTHQNQNILKRFDFFGDEELISGVKLKSTYVTLQHCILLSLTRDKFFRNVNNEDQKKLKKYRNQHVVVNYPEFQKQIRKQKQILNYKKRVVKHAIDVSFCNKSTLPQLQRTKNKLEGYQKHMLDNVQKILDEL